MNKSMRKNNVGGRWKPNKYRNLKPSEQRNTSGQRRVRRAAEAESIRVAYEASQAKEED
jgi:hypothetical protein